MLDFWKQTVESAKEEFSDHVFNTWIKPLQYKTTKKDEVCVEVPNNLYKEKIKKFYYPFLVEKYRAISNNGTMDICFELSSSQKKKPQPEITLVKKEKKPIESSTFLPHYTFETFVVGNNNHLAFAASEGICEEPGRKFNPLLLYGGVGLGKTHLLHAIGNYFTKKDASLSIVYKTSEEFMNDLVHGIRFEKMDVFRNRYRHCDVLLIDDIQFFSGKERTQEEFFHTFNVLFQENKQIVVTSDRLPSEIPDLDNRLRSRFQSGLFCDIQTPDLETRIAILKRKA
ncbi:MAG: ATP-binding protein, partial [Bdellovibrionales bacterium]|nr:ATP-binding protein [Bdellovibrionales bacterium]